jgi:hypothetical protein
MSAKYSIQYKNFEATKTDEPLPIIIRNAVNTERVIRFVASDESIDHDGEVIKQDGWDLGQWIANPVCQGFHDRQSWPLGSGIAVGVVNNKLMLDIEFDPPEIDERADLVFKKIMHGTVKAGSVGFVPLAWKTAGDPGTEYLFAQHPGATRIFTRQKLMEWTVCPIGANPNALAVARAKEFDAEPLERAATWSASAMAAIEKKIENINKLMKG